MSSLSDQLLKVGLVTENQANKATEKSIIKKKKSYKQARKNKPSDLAKFYQQRASDDKKEKEAAVQKKIEAAKQKKIINKKIKKLLTDNLLNDDTADIRYNFVVGTTIKYLYVTHQQQKDLADSKIAITFLGGKRVLIPIEVALEITKLNPEKIIIYNISG